LNLFSSLLTRVRNYAGPRDLPTGTSFGDGMARQSAPLARSVTRWHLADLEAAIIQADNGNLRTCGQLCSSLRRDGVIAGVLSTRTDGLVQLPVKFAGEDADLRAELQKDFRAVFPHSELALLSGDGRLAGVGLGEFVQIKGALPTLVRRDPEFLQYRWAEDRWYYQTIRGPEPVNPGDGRWVLHCPGGAIQPWRHGLWTALSRAFIAKEHAYYYRENYSSKLANAARVAVSPQGATEVARLGFFQRLAAWGVNTVFELPQGWDVKLLESNGRGYEVFQQTIETANQEAIVTLSGQTVTTDGGAGFQNSDIHRTIRSDLIQSDADALAATLNIQGIPVWANERFGSAAVKRAPRVSWDVTPPKDLKAEADAMNMLGNAIKVLNETFAADGKSVDLDEIARKFGIPVKALEAAEKMQMPQVDEKQGAPT
jgi:hypothetical protein